MLLFKYADEHQPPFWATPGGELRAGETYRAAARRELFEETGLVLPIGELLRKRDATYAVARSTASRWLEEYYLVRYDSRCQVYPADWTEEERETIQHWAWWTRDEMLSETEVEFKPDWLPDLMKSVTPLVIEGDDDNT